MRPSPGAAAALSADRRLPIAATGVHGLTLLGVAAAATGCLVPIPLDQEVPLDGGTSLKVVEAMPMFGTTTAISSTMPFNFQIDIETDNPKSAGRLYLQVNDSCCNLDVENPNVTRFRQHADAQQIEPGKPRYKIDFSQTELPCGQGFSGTRVFLVPVITSGGFKDGPMGIRPEAFGDVDRSHYWTINCP